MKKIILITGATGFVGKKLTSHLLNKGYDVRVITRNSSSAKKKLPASVSYFEWKENSDFPIQALENVHGVIHLAGENIASGRWTEERKKEILESRTLGTKALIDAVQNMPKAPEVVVGTSAIGIYGDRSSEILFENSSFGNGFLSDVCKGWEKSYEGFKGRLALLRVGVVLGDGGALKKMLPPFKMGVGGKLASGDQWMSWIHIDDLVLAYTFLLENSSTSGVYNAVANSPVTNLIFTKTLGKCLHRPTILPVPALAIKTIFGEMSEVLLGSQRVSNEKIVSAGLELKYPKISTALGDILG